MYVPQPVIKGLLLIALTTSVLLDTHSLHGSDGLIYKDWPDTLWAVMKLWKVQCKPETEKFYYSWASSLQILVSIKNYSQLWQSANNQRNHKEVFGSALTLKLNSSSNSHKPPWNTVNKSVNIYVSLATCDCIIFGGCTQDFTELARLFT